MQKIIVIAEREIFSTRLEFCIKFNIITVSAYYRRHYFFNNIAL